MRQAKPTMGLLGAFAAASLAVAALAVAGCTHPQGASKNQGAPTGAASVDAPGPANPGGAENSGVANGAEGAPARGAPAAQGQESNETVRVLTADAIRRAEDARVAALVRLHARGIIEMRTKDETGEHFDQGDLDLRWSSALGMAASLSKLGDRWVWIGADTREWWIFELKSKPTKLQTGLLTSAKASLAPAFPWLLGVRPLRPAPGAEPELVKLKWRVLVEVPAGVLPSGATLRAEFDPATALPVGTELTLPGGAVWRSGFADWMSVETEGVATGAWPRVPRRVQAASGQDDRWTTVRVALDTARADAAATDKPALYDLAGLRERFAPQVVETEP